MANRIHKDERVAGLHENLFCPYHGIGRAAQPNAVRVILRGRIVGLVAAGDDHRAAIAGTDVGQRYQNIYLPVHKVPVVEAELIALTGVMAAGVDSNRFTRSSQIGKVFVYEQRAVMEIK